jgi:hypothetical protein
MSELDPTAVRASPAQPGVELTVERDDETIRLK